MEWKTDITLETTLPLGKETIQFFFKNLLKNLFLANQNILAMYVAK